MFDDDSAAWGAPTSSSSGDIVKDAIKKEQTIKFVLCLKSYQTSFSPVLIFRELIAAQEDLRGKP